jgi:hypothetical protein
MSCFLTKFYFHPRRIHHWKWASERKEYVLKYNIEGWKVGFYSRKIDVAAESCVGYSWRQHIRRGSVLRTAPPSPVRETRTFYPSPSENGARRRRGFHDSGVHTL